jgi:homoserine kinase type II
MALFRTLTVADVNEILDGFGAAPATAHAPIPVGTINTNVRVETAGGRYFLRINEGKAEDDVEREAAIVAHLAGRGVPTPAPLRALDGTPYLRWQGQFVSLFPWLEGRTLTRAELTADHARAVGRALASLHLAGTDYPDRRSGRYEPHEIDRRLATVVDLQRSDLADALAVLEPELGALRTLRRPNLPEGLIHGDLFIDNVMFALSDQPALRALIDFEQASWGRLAYDLAVTTLAFGYGRDDFRAEIVAALFEGYTAMRVPSADERAAFGAELRFAACRFAVTRITDVHLRRAEGAAPGKDFRRYLARLASVKAHLQRGSETLVLP